jgi:CheY-like chemotaxis protein
VSVRQLRREQHAALETLAYELWTEFDLHEERVERGEPAEGTPSTAETTEKIIEELGWLKQKAPDTVTILNELIPPAVSLAEALCRRHEVQLETDVPEEAPDLAAHPIAVRQMLLNLLTVAIPRATGGRVSLAAHQDRFDVEFDVQGEPGDGDGNVRSLSDDEARNLQVAEQLAKMSGGQLSLCSPTPGFSAKLRLPAAQQMPILILDDNLDALQLLQRYTSGTRYQAVATQRPDALISLAAAHKPSAIVLDVMMPDIDGWEMIGRLLQHPNTTGVPIIVCSILAQTELAMSLGASAYLQKPVSRQAFLDALDQHVLPQEPAPAKESG